MKIQEYQEHKLTLAKATAVNKLLQTCFSGYPSDRNYYKSLPTFRLLAQDKRTVVGHLAVVYRIVKIGSTVARVFGISDVCVHPEYRSNNIASLLLDRLEENCKTSRIDFLILVAEDHTLYKKRGYEPVSNTVRWLLINDQQSLGVMHGNLNRSLMVKKMGILDWNDGILDLLGGVF